MIDTSQQLRLRPGLTGAALSAAAFAILLVVKSLADFSYTGPTIRAEIAEHFFAYSLLSVTKLGLWAFAVALLLASAGVLVLVAVRPAQKSPGVMLAFIAGGIGIGIGSVYQFAHVLIYAPGTILASWNYAPWRLVQIWPLFNPTNLLIAKTMLLALPAIAVIVLLQRYLSQARRVAAGALGLSSIAVATLVLWIHWQPEPAAGGLAHAAAYTKRPNIVMIGSDTLRADRLGVAGYERDVTPTIDQLAARGTYFAQAYAPIGRTAPSITTILTGLWPDSHGIRDNFVRDEQKQLKRPALPALLRQHGYHTAAVGDWAASDLGKIGFGFDELRVSPDQWNFKYLLSQGPKDLRLWVSLFVDNEFGRIFIPQLYYIAGRPLTSEMGRYTRHLLNELAQAPEPFFLMHFVATTHPPFGSEYPYYTLFSGVDYAGNTKFAITGVSTPEEIAKRQSQGREAFDVQQIINLYDSATRHFDDEVNRIVSHIESLGIADNTIIIIFSDHGTDLFERDSWGQGNTVGAHDYSTHIPLLIVDPRRLGTASVQRVVRAVDLAPTIMELAGVNPAEHMEGVPLTPYLDDAGQNLRLASYNESGALLAHIAGMEENRKKAPPLQKLLQIPDKVSGTISISAEGQRAIEAARQKAMRTERWVAMLTPLEGNDSYMLFDLASDPDGSRDVAAQYPAVLACFRSAFGSDGTLAQRLDALPACLENVIPLVSTGNALQ